MRTDLFIVWGSGIKHLNAVAGMIRDKFRIVLVHRHEIDDMDKFVSDVYACDSYPMKHLIDKTRYLLNTQHECYLFLVENNNVDEQMVGQPPYRKPQCMYLQKVKMDIRARFNPAPNEHMIHGTDYESQVDHILPLLGLNNKEHYTRKIDFPTHYPWHLPVPKRYKKVMVTPDMLKVNILGKGYVGIKESPHYQYVQGDTKHYEYYHRMHCGLSLKEDHFPEAFTKMFGQEFDPIIINGNNVLDGVHRLAIMADHNISIKAYNVNF